VGGSCICQTNFGDCNGDLTLGDAGNGCEAELLIDEVGELKRNVHSAADEATTMAIKGDGLMRWNVAYDYNTMCIDVRPLPQAHCGACGISCPANSQCMGGKCVCLTNFADCNNDLESTTSDGCEIDLSTDRVGENTACAH
jgi:hypothetical protein